MDLLRDLLFGLGPIQAVQELFGLGNTVPFRAISMLGDTWGILLAVGVGFWLFGRRALYAVIAVTIFAAGSWLVVSGLFSVSRPSGAEIVVYDHLEYGAFPSGHVTQATAAWGMIYALGLVPLAVPVLAAVLTGLGRIYLGAHFLSDVLGGMVYGALVVAVFFQLWKRVRGWLADRSDVFYRVAAGLAFAAGVIWLLQLPAGESERRVEVIAVLIAGALALPAEYRWLRYSPARSGRSGSEQPPRAWRTAAMVAIGLAGLTALVLAKGPLAPHLPWATTLFAAAAVAWVVLAAPALFQKLGWAQRQGRHSSRPQERNA